MGRRMGSCVDRYIIGKDGLLGGWADELRVGLSAA